MMRELALEGVTQRELDLRYLAGLLNKEGQRRRGGGERAGEWKGIRGRGKEEKEKEKKKKKRKRR